MIKSIRMRAIYFLFGILLLSMVSCRSVVVNNDSQIISDSQPQLGAIGLLDRNLLNRTFKTVEVPLMSERIRLELHKEKFDKKGYAAYLNTSPENKYQITYIDSLPEKPEFISLQLSDRLTYIEEIKSNHKLISYLKSKPQLQTVTSISVATQPEILSFFEDAESIFLVYNKKLKEYYMELLEKNGSKQKIHFNDLSVFAFGTSGYCWGTNYKHKVELKMLADNNKCSKGLKKKASNVNIEKDYLNF